MPTAATPSASRIRSAPTPRRPGIRRPGQQVAFVSDRGGTPQLYTMDADGGDVQKLPLPDMGYVIDPAWSPNGQLLAFSWRRPNGNYDLYVMDIATHELVELTRDAGRNERPSWAPDGRHLVFESTRTGTRQIWSMLADGTDARQLTTEGRTNRPTGRRNSADTKQAWRAENGCFGFWLFCQFSSVALASSQIPRGYKCIDLIPIPAQQEQWLKEDL